MGKKYFLFAAAYNAFDLIAEKLKETAGTAIIRNALATLNPTVAFFDIVSTMCKIDTDIPNGFVWTLPDKLTNRIANLSYEQADFWFSSLLRELNPDDSRYGRAYLSEITQESKQDWSSLLHELEEDDFIEFLFDSTPTMFLFTPYYRVIHPFVKPDFSKPELSEPIERGNRTILLEAIRQQLTTGIGLLCPFWMYSPDQCCNSDNKELLEKVWSCTSHNSSCNWRRMGCLQDGLVRRVLKSLWQIKR
jgi:hypothetical protein